MTDITKLTADMESRPVPTEVMDTHHSFASAVVSGDDITAPKPVEQDIDWWEYTQKSAEAHWIFPQDWFGKEFESEEDYDGTSDENVGFIPKDFSTDQMEEVMSANSAAEREYLITEFQNHNELQHELAQAGIGGVGVQMAVSMFDPVSIGASLLTFGMAAPWIYAAKGSRSAVIASRMLKAGAVTAGTEVGIAGMRMGADVNYDAEDAALDIALATTFGTALGWMGRPIKNAVNARTIDKADEALRQSGHIDAVGADKVNEDPVAAQFARVDSLAQITKHGNVEASKYAKTMLEDAIDAKDQTVALQAHTDRNHYITQFNKVASDNLRAWQKEQGFGMRKRIFNPVEEVRMQKEFSKLVFRELEIGDVDDNHVKAAAAMLTKQRNEMAQKASAQGVEGFGDLDDANKITHKWNFTRVTQAVDEHGEDAIDLIYEGLKAGARKYGRTTNMDADELAAHESYLKMMAVGFSKRAQRITTGDDLELDNILKGNVDAALFLKGEINLDDIDGLLRGDLKEKFLAKRAEGVPEEELLEFGIQSVLKKALNTKGKKEGSNRIDRAKLRMDLDLSVSKTINGAEGNTQLNLIDMFDNDAFNLHHQYTRNLTGWTAMAQGANPIRGPQDWQKMLDKVKASELDRLTKTGSNENIEKTYGTLKKKLEQAKKEVFGENVYEELEGNFWRSMNVMRRYNFTTSMGMAALSALSEMGRVYAEGGIKNTLRNVPELKKVMRTAFKPGEGDSIAADFNTFGASIGDEHLMTAIAGFDGDNVVKVGTFTKMDKADIVSQKVQRAMAQAALLAPVDRTMRQLGFAIRHTAFYRHFKYGDKLKFKPESLGLSEKDMQELKDAMLAHSVEGKLGGVEKSGVENWPPSIRHKYIQAMTRADARQVQKMIAGQDVTWMQHPAARIFMQFRTFVANSYTKHFLADTYSILKGDGRDRATTLVSIGMSSILAAIAYKTRVEVAAIGRDDADEFREKRLSEGNMIRNAAMYTPAFGAPMTLWDMSVGTVRPDLAISPFRSSGLQSTGVMSNPTADKADRFVKLLGDAASEDEDRYGRTVARKTGFLIPFANTIPGSIALNLTDKALKD